MYFQVDHRKKSAEFDSLFPFYVDIPKGKICSICYAVLELDICKHCVGSFILMYDMKIELKIPKI